MKFKESPHIPLPLLKALKSDAYRESLEAHFKDLPANIKGKFQHTMSVTTLARSPRQLQLSLRHSHEIVIDLEERRHALFGRIGHSILEENKGPGDVVEERLGIIFPLVIEKKLPGGKVIATRVDYYVHGAADLYNYAEGFLDDYKFPKTGSLRYSKKDYHAQLNILGYIWRKNGRKVTRLRNVYLLIKDWNPQFVKDEPGHEYPKSWIVPQDVPMWSDEECMAYLNERLTRHYLNEGKPDDEIDPCDDDELWRSEPRYKVFKLDEDGHPQKTAKYNGASKEVAHQTLEALRQSSREKVLAENAKKKKPKDAVALKFDSYVLHELPSSPRRCGFCDARNHCSQRLQQLIAEMESNQSTEHEEEDL
jgi:hypothetical protein